MTIKLIKILLLLLLLEGCIPRIRISKLIKPVPGFESISFERKGTYPEPVINYFVKKIRTPDKINIISGIELFKVSYFTKDEENKQILVSGLLAIPRNKKIKGVVSYQRGTNSERLNAPSKPSQDEGLGISAAFAGGVIYV